MERALAGPAGGAETQPHDTLMTSILFICFVLGFAALIWKAGGERRMRPESQPGPIIRIVGDGEEGGVRMNIGACICTCPDWQQNRGRFAAAAPMRLCRHLTAYFARHQDALPGALRSRAPLILAQARAGAGLPCGPGTEYGHLEDTPYVLYARKAVLPRVPLILGGARYVCDVEKGTWEPQAPPQAAHFMLRSRQLAEMVKA